MIMGVSLLIVNDVDVDVVKVFPEFFWRVTKTGNFLAVT
jgi:hypothetical protein